MAAPTAGHAGANGLLLKLSLLTAGIGVMVLLMMKKQRREI